MNLDVNALVTFLPQFVIGGVIALYFYTSFKKYRPGPIGELEFKPAVMEGNSQGASEPGTGESSALDSVVRKSMMEDGVDQREEIDFSSRSSDVDLKLVRNGMERKDLVSDTQLILVAINIWILGALVLSSESTVKKLMPSIPGLYSQVLYSALAAFLAVAIMTTVASRINFTKRTLAIFIAAAGGITFGLFYAPSMKWASGLNSLIHLTVIYSAAVMACAAAYAVSSYMQRRSAFSTAAYLSFASYGITVSLLFYNFLSHAF